MDEDAVDIAVAQWRAERPDVDFDAMGPLARLARLGILGAPLVDAVFAADGLDRGEFAVLASLRRAGAPYRLTPSQLADAELTTRGGMTKRVDKLERRGLVERTPSVDDRRSFTVGLTDSGMKLIDRVIPRHAQNETRLLDVLTPGEVAALDAALRKLLARVEGAATP